MPRGQLLGGEEPRPPVLGGDDELDGGEPVGVQTTTTVS